MGCLLIEANILLPWGKIILFEKIIPGEGTDGTSNPENHTLPYHDGYFKYEETEDTKKIIKREFTEF